MRIPTLIEGATPNRLMQALPYIGGSALGATGLYGANALLTNGNKREDRITENTAGNAFGGLAGAYTGVTFGRLPGMIVGGIAGTLGGGYLSDRIADIFDPTHGQIQPVDLLNRHLEVQQYQQ